MNVLKRPLLHNKKDENKIAENSLPERKTQSIFDEALDFCEASQDFWQKGELENALEALDHAYSLILEIDTDDTAKPIQQPKKAKKDFSLKHTSVPENIGHKLFPPLKKQAFRLNCHGSRLLKADIR